MSQGPKVVLFVVDGMRPDGLLQADTPTLDRLMATGATTLRARAVMPSVTLPCHMSLFLGVDPRRHGITTNTWTPQARPVPGLFGVLRSAGRVSASFYNWEQLRDLSRPGSLDAAFFLDNCHYAEGTGDLKLAELASRWLRENPADFAFVYLGYTDIAGHDHGWMTAPYLRAIANADLCIGLVLEALPRDTVVIVTSDHGGHEQTHGTDMDQDMIIPLILSEPGMPSGVTIERTVGLIDAAPTIARLFGIEGPDDWSGEPLILA